MQEAKSKDHNAPSTGINEWMNALHANKTGQNRMTVLNYVRPDIKSTMQMT